MPPQLRHTGGRTVPHRRHDELVVGVGWRPPRRTARTAPSRRSATQASSAARPLRLSTHTTRPSATQRLHQPVGEQARSADVLVAPVDRRRPRASRRARPGATGPRSSPQASASRVGTGETSTHGTPARRARSTTTSRACQVGARSCCQRSSCSSSTTTAARSGTGAHAAARVPTTVAPAAAWAQSRGMTATADPRPAQAQAQVAGGGRPTAPGRGRGPEPQAASDDGVGVGGRRPGAPRRGRGQRVGRQRVDRRPGRDGTGGERAGGGRARTAASGDAVRSSWAGPAGPAPRRPVGQVDQLGRRPPAGHLGDRASGPRPGGGSTPTATTQPPTRRPCRATRTIVPTRTSPAMVLGDQVVEGLGDGRLVRQHPHHRAHGPRRREPRVRSGDGSGRAPRAGAGRGRRPGARREREGQSPSAERRSSTLSVRSQVKPPSSDGRPKWP